MLDFYAWPTPNGRKIAIALAEMALPHRVIPVDIGKGEQFDPEYLKISPNNKIPAIVDHDGPGGRRISLFESGAILLYLGEKTGKFLPSEPEAHWATVQWLMWQMGGFGPLLGQAEHFLTYATEKVPYAIERYSNEARRLWRVLDTRLGQVPYVAGDEYTIADIAIFPWARSIMPALEIDFNDYPNAGRWLARVEARPAVRAGMQQMLKQAA